MSKAVFEKTSTFPVSARELVSWHARPGAFERLNPPFAPARVASRSGEVDEDGSEVVLEIPGPVGRVRWTARHSDYDPQQGFTDTQVTGPFASWKHRHQVESLGQEPQEAQLTDHIEFAMPLAALGGGIAAPVVRRMLDRTFRYRHATTKDDLTLHARYGLKPLRIAVTGSTGLVGEALCALLTTGGHTVLRLVRNREAAQGPETIYWNPTLHEIEAEKLEGLDAIVHLAGENIAGGRWTAKRKQAILESRTLGTKLIARAIAGLESKPAVLVNASAIGWYGDRDDEALNETSEAGEGFLAEVCQQWEQATEAARDAKIRTVHLRIGVVMSAGGGALATMLPPFKLGAGGVLGSGSQYMSWISIDDVLGSILHCIATDSLEGAVNATAPEPVTNRELTKTLGSVLARPTIAPVPKFAAKIAFGEMADALLLSSTRVLPEKLLKTGYQFRHPDLEQTLRHTLGRPKKA